MMNVLAISDLHGYLPEIPECDLLLLGGDYNPKRNLDLQLRFMLGPFKDWLNSVEARHVVAIAGNHDFVLQSDHKRLLKAELPWIYLEDESVDIEGVKIYGTPWTKTFGDWAFMRDEGPLRQIFSNIPKDLNILLSHGPAKEILDKNQEGESCGSYQLAYRINEVKPDSVVCGHIHEGRGIKQQGDIRYYNVTHVSRDYEPIYGPMHIPLKARDE